MASILLSLRPGWHWLAVMGLTVVAIILGVVSALQSYWLLVAIPIFAPLFLSVVWASPEPRKPPYVLLNIFFLFVLSVFILWPRYGILPLGGIPLSPPRILYSLLIVVWFAALFWSANLASQLMERVRKNALPVLLLLGLLFWKFLSVFNSTDVVRSLYGFFTEAIVYFLMFPICLTLFRSVKDIERVLVVLLLAGLGTCLLGIYEGFTHHNVFLAHFPAMTEYMDFALSSKERGGGYRVQSTFAHPLLFAEFLVILLPIAVTFALDKRRLFKILGAIALGPILVAMYKTGSRAAIIGFAVVAFSAVVFFVLRYMKQRNYDLKSFVVLFVILSVLVVSMALVTGALFDIALGRGIEARSTSVRLAIMTQGSHLLMSEPLLGFGVDQSAPELDRIMAGGLVTQTVDNYYLSLALDSGLPALLLYLSSFIYFVLLAIKLSLRHGREPSALAAGLALSLIGYAIIRLILSVPHSLSLLFAAFAMLIVLREEADAPSIIAKPEGGI